MTFTSPDRSARAYPGLLTLCIVLAVCALLAAAAGVWMLAVQPDLTAGLALGAGGLLGAAAWGLYRLKRWGVICFGLLALLGSVNHLAATLIRYNSLSLADPLRIVAALFSILLAIAIPLGLFYLALILWRLAR